MRIGNHLNLGENRQRHLIGQEEEIMMVSQQGNDIMIITMSNIIAQNRMTMNAHHHRPIIIMNHHQTIDHIIIAQIMEAHLHHPQEEQTPITNIQHQEEKNHQEEETNE